MVSQFHGLRRLLAIRQSLMMEFLLGGIAVVICIGLALRGYTVALILGAIVGSFFGVSGFGGALSGALPGAIVGALIAHALRLRTPP